MLQTRRGQTLAIAIRYAHYHSTGTQPKPSSVVDEFIRVDHAGELGADRIYAGQMAILGEFQCYLFVDCLVKYECFRQRSHGTHHQTHVGART